MIKSRKRWHGDILALDLCALWVIVTVEEASFEQLNGYDSKYELEKHVDDHDVEDVLQRVDDTVEHGLIPKKRQQVQKLKANKSLTEPFCESQKQAL